MNVDEHNHEIDLSYGDYMLLSITREGKFKLYNGIANNIGLCVDEDGELFEESV